MRIPELLAPVGSMDHLKVAINAGASSIYLSEKNMVPAGLLKTLL